MDDKGISPSAEGDQGFAFGNHELFEKSSPKTYRARFARTQTKPSQGALKQQSPMITFVIIGDFSCKADHHFVFFFKIS